jgi:exosortase/archaeosortase family protein
MSTLRKLLQNPLFRFICLLSIFLLLGFLLRTIYKVIPEVHLSVLTSSSIDTFYRILIYSTSYLLGIADVNHIVGYSKQSYQYFINFPSTNISLYLYISCLGISLTYIYISLILSYPGKLSRKIFYIVCGIIFIQILNIMRLFALSLTLASSSFQFNDASKLGSGLVKNHEPLFNIVVIIAIFLMFVSYTASAKMSNKKSNN